MKLNRINEVPLELYNCNLENIHNVLKGPTLIHIKGERSEALVLGCLLHGNETTSFLSIQSLLKKYKNERLPRDLIIFFGNTEAASLGKRHLPGQPDYNRIWENGDTPEHKIAKDVIEYLEQEKLFACIDIHNNSGKNPFYACINYTHPEWIQLASIFSSDIVYFTEPSEVLSNAVSRLCPSVTIEAGLPGLEEGVIAVQEYIEDVLYLDEFQSNLNPMDYEVYHTIGRIMIKSRCSVDFENKLTSSTGLSFIPLIDEKNFELVKKNTHFGYANDLSGIRAIDNNEKDITEDIFHIVDGSLQTNRMFIPAMFTKDIYIMKDDCMGYIMEKMIPLKSVKN